jgi:hypothetical protein
VKRETFWLMILVSVAFVSLGLGLVGAASQLISWQDLLGIQINFSRGNKRQIRGLGYAI